MSYAINMQEGSGPFLYGDGHHMTVLLKSRLRIHVDLDLDLDLDLCLCLFPCLCTYFCVTVDSCWAFSALGTQVFGRLRSGRCGNLLGLSQELQSPALAGTA